MATAKTPENWAIVQTGNGPAGAFHVWQNVLTELEIMLPKSMKPDTATLAAFAMNGIEPKARSEDSVIESESPNGFEEHDEPEPESALDRIMSTLGQRDLSSRSEIRVYKIREADTDLYCGKFTPEEFEEQDLELIRSHFGGGKFRLVIMGMTPKFDEAGAPIRNGGKFVPLMKPVVEIAESLKPIAGAVPVAGDALSIRVLERLDRIENNRPQNNGPQSMQEMLALMIQMQQAFGNKGGGNNGGSSSVARMAEDIKALKELESTLGGGKKETENDSLMEMGSKVIEMIGEARASGNNPVQTGAIQPVQIPQTFQPEPEADDMNMLEKAFINGTVSGLVKAAAANEDIEKHAVYLADKAPDELIDVMEAPTWFTSFTEMFPQVPLNSEPWFLMLRNRILELAFEPEAPVKPVRKPPVKKAVQPKK